MIEEFDEHELFEKINALSVSGPAYKHYRPISDAADEYIKWSQDTESRVYTGIAPLDGAIRGTAPGELTLIQGHVHSGKTLVATELLLANTHIPIVVFTPDETRPLVLTKLAAATHGVGAKQLEAMIQEDNVEAHRILKDTAAAHSRLAVFDETVTTLDMEHMFNEAAHAFGETPKAVIFDYAELLAGHDDPRTQLSALKAWGKRMNTAMFVLHQTSRTAGAGGRKLQINSGNYGGEQQAMHVIGVRRKKYMYLQMLAELEEKMQSTVNEKLLAQYESKYRDIMDYEMPKAANTVTVSLVKNKRPPCDLIDDIDYTLDSQTGRLSAEPPPRRPVVNAEYISNTQRILGERDSF
jgi:KaiC/GvpD/RAD55 family RecA-like ATPase